jgi:hypothetical protein
MYMKCWALPSFRDYGHDGVLCTYTVQSAPAAEICSSSCNLQQQLKSAAAAAICNSSCNLQQQLQSAAAAAICSSSCNLQQQLQSAAAAGNARNLQLSSFLARQAVQYVTAGGTACRSQ